MNRKEAKKNIPGLWRAIHAVIWLIGIAILAANNWWWPGILVLVAISVLLEAYLRRKVPQEYEEEPAKVPESPKEAEPEAPPPAATASSDSAPAMTQEHHAELLPQTCPNCNAPIRGHEVKWSGPQSADCPYCGTNLPMNKA